MTGLIEVEGMRRLGDEDKGEEGRSGSLIFRSGSRRDKSYVM